MDLINSPYGAESIELLERLVLSIMLNDQQMIPNVVARLQPHNFTNVDNKALYRRIKEFYLAKNTMDPNLLITYIKNEADPSFENISQFVAELMILYTNSYDLNDYIEIILMESTLRDLRAYGEKLKTLNIDYYKYDDEVWNIQKEFLDIVNSKTSNSLLDTKSVTKNFMDRLELLKNHGGKLTGTTTGFKTVNEFTNGFQPGELIILAARPSIGKTALALNMLLAAAKECNENECVVIFSLEMGSQQLMERLVSCETSINSYAFKRGTWQDDDEFLINECIDRMNKLPILIDESTNLSILEIQTKLKQIAANKKIKLVVIDYLQLVTGTRGQGVNRQIEVAQISRTLKSLARDIEAPIISVAQLSRKVEERRGNDKKSKPILSDLRESGSIEQDADIVIFLNYERDEIDEKKSSNNTKQYANTVIVDFIIAKNRSGATGELKLLFEKTFGRYSDYNNY